MRLIKKIYRKELLLGIDRDEGSETTCSEGILEKRGKAAGPTVEVRIRKMK